MGVFNPAKGLYLLCMLQVIIISISRGGKLSTEFRLKVLFEKEQYMYVVVCTLLSVAITVNELEVLCAVYGILVQPF